MLKKEKLKHDELEKEKLCQQTSDSELDHFILRNERNERQVLPGIKTRVLLNSHEKELNLGTKGWAGGAVA
jgi:hypothetical protein